MRGLNYLYLLIGLLKIIHLTITDQAIEAFPFNFRQPGTGLNEVSCFNEFKQLGNACYKVFKEKLTFDNARSFCRSLNSDLVTIDGASENQYIDESVKEVDLTIKEFWIGMHRINKDDNTDDKSVYWTINGKNIKTDISVGYWAPNQPDNTKGKCAKVNNGRWSWTWCGEKLPFICKSNTCAANQYLCSNGRCIRSELKCDGQYDCMDKSDEYVDSNDCVKRCTNYTPLNAESGIITSENYPAAYSNQKTCTWIIRGPVGRRIQLNFDDLNTESSSDIIEIWLGSSNLNEARFAATISGVMDVKKIPTFLSDNNYMIVRFLTDSTISRNGFKATWTSLFACKMIEKSGYLQSTDILQDIPNTEHKACMDTCQAREGCNAFTYYTVEKRCIMHVQIVKPTPDSCCTYWIKTCPNTIGTKNVEEIPGSGDNSLMATNNWRYIASAFYPNNYPSQIKTRWIITAPKFTLITIQIIDMKLAENDKLVIKNGDNAQAKDLLSITGSNGNNILLTTTTNNAYIYFDSISQITNMGFQIRYKIGCDIELTATNGAIQTPGYGIEEYPILQKCKWTIKLSVPIRLIFPTNKVFFFGSGDNLKIYKETLVQDTTKQVHAGSGFTGNNRPGVVDSINGQMYIEFQSDTITNGEGFYAEYSIGCPTITLNQNTILDGNTILSNKFDASFKLACKDTSYYFNGEFISSERSIEMKCLAGGKWNLDKIPQCMPKYCGHIPDVINGYIESTTGVIYNSEANYKCFEGFSITPTGKITCQNNGWQKQPTCLSTNCPSKSPSPNSKINITYGDGTAYGSVLRSICNEGYEYLSGSHVIYCQGNGIWSNQLSLCQKKKCKLNSNIENGVANKNDILLYNEVVTFTCNAGYKINGTSQITCTADGTLSPSKLPFCEDINECEDLSHKCSEICVNNVGSYTCKCKSGFQLMNNGINCADIDECLVDNGGCGDHKCINSLGSYRCECNSGFELFQINGQSGFLVRSGETGLQNGDVYHINHTCIPLECKDPIKLTIDNMEVFTKKQRFYVGDEVQYECKLGYRISNNAIRTKRVCLNTGKWDKTEPSCVVARCDAFDLPTGIKNGPINVNPTGITSYGEKVTWECDLTMLGQPGVKVNKFRTCLWDTADGKPANQNYRLIGDEIECGYIDCKSPGVIPGMVDVTLTSTLLGSSFNFQCKTGFTKSGSSKAGDSVVRCLSNGQWDLNNLKCSGPSCTDPGTPPEGMQKAISYEEGQIVEYSCEKPGYESVPKQKKCIFSSNSAIWDDSTLAICKDIQKPEFVDCKSNGQIILNKLDRLLINKPKVLDNSGAVKEITLKPGSVDISQAIKSDSQVTWVATDFEGNSAECEVTIKIRKATEVKIFDCPTHQTLYLEQLLEDRQVATKNAGSFPKAVKTEINPQVIRINKDNLEKVFTVKIRAWDTYNNMVECSYQYLISAGRCADWSLRTPENGIKNCIVEPGGRVCTMTCNEKYVFPDDLKNTKSYKCTAGGEWDIGNEVPDCVLPINAQYIQTLEIPYKDTNSQGILSDECKLAYISELRSKKNTIENLVDSQVHCSTVTVRFVNDIDNAITGSIVLDEFRLQLQWSISPFEQTIQKKERCATVTSAIIKSLDPEEAGLGQQLGKITTSGINCPRLDLLSSSTAIYSNRYGYSCPLGLHLKDDKCIPCPPGYFSDKLKCLKCARGFYQESINQNTCIKCPTGTHTYSEGSLSRNDCKPVCQAGMFSANSLPPCSACPSDTYWSSPDRCTTCPSGTTTLDRTGQIDVSGCKAQCKPGTFSETGREPCRKCPIGYYQQFENSQDCLECNSDSTTSIEGSTSSNDCISAANKVCNPSPCVHGVCQTKYHRASCTCSPGWTGEFCDININECESNPCYYNGICTDLENDFKCECPVRKIVKFTEQANKAPKNSTATGLISSLSASECQETCKNNEACTFALFKTDSQQCAIYVGQSTILVDYNNCLLSIKRFEELPAYGGKRCQDEPNDCLDNKCENGAMCQDLIAGYKCLCLTNDQYSGTFCDEAVNICTKSPCVNGVCEELSPFRRQCKCSSGFTGKDCELNIDECASNPCFNGGICKDGNNGYQCLCNTKYFQGNQCEIRLTNPCNGIDCSGKGQCIEDYPLSATKCICQPGYRSDYFWTDWLNKDTPESDSGDEERYVSNQVCSGTKPIGIECRSSLTKKIHTNTGDKLNISCVMDVGLICYNKEQSLNKTCQDYEIRYKCSILSIRNGISDCVVDDECQNEPCEKGSCITKPGETPGYICSCPTGFVGSKCQHEIDECLTSNCQNGATCIDKQGSYECYCPSGYEGFNCQIQTLFCDTYNPCSLSNTLNCINKVNGYECVCKPGYAGVNCTLDVNECDSNPCLNNAPCNNLENDFQCECPSGYDGKTCEKMKNFCDSQPCQRESECFNVFGGYYCACKPGTFGKMCEEGPQLCNKANPCLNSGTCKIESGKAVCECSSQYTGYGCELEKDYCNVKNSICKNGATCTIRNDLSIGYSCQCPTGFTGINCQENINDCQNVNCGINGICVDGINEYFCRCPPDYTGEDCSKKVDRKFDLEFLKETKDANAISFYPFEVNSKKFTIGFFIRFAIAGDKPNEAFLQLYEALSETSRKQGKKLLEINDLGLTMYFNNIEKKLFFKTTNINNRQWHYVSVTFDSLKPNAVLYMDGVVMESTPTYAPDFQLPKHCLFKVGSFFGYLSLVQLWNSVLTLTDLKNIYNTKTITDLLLPTLKSDWMTMYMEKGANRIIPSGRNEIICETDKMGPSCQLNNDRFGPQIITCPGDKLVESGGKRLVQVDWVPPTITRAKTISQNYVPGQVFTVGSYQVIYVARDEAENTAICAFKIYVRLGKCSAPSSPENSAVAPICKDYQSGKYVNCEPKCPANTYFSMESPNFYTCGPIGVFNIKDPWHSFKYPSCAIIGTKTFAIKATWSYNLNSCQATEISALQSKILEDLKKAHSQQQIDFGAGFCKTDANCANSKIEVMCDGNIAKASLELSDTYENIKGIETAALLYKAAIQDGYFTSSTVAGADKITPDTFKVTSKISCNDGFHIINNLCVECVKGFYFNTTTKICSPCPIGQYQTISRENKCLACDPGRTTATEGSSLTSDCINACPMGEYYDMQQSRCIPCKVGYYQNKIGQTYCRACLLGETTKSEGSKAVSDCIDQCDSGEYLKPDGSCEKCPIGTYRNKDEKQLSCQQCTVGRTTKLEGAKSKDDCNRIKCEAGSFRQGDDPGVCQLCSKGTYRTSSDTTNVCSSCPLGMTTANEGSVDDTFCKFHCPPGAYITVIVVNGKSESKCVQCKQNTYKNENAPFATNCENCPADKPRTFKEGSKSIDECKYGNCTKGYIVNQQDPTKCDICPIGTYQPNGDPGVADKCIVCATGKTTKQKGSISEDLCVQVCSSGSQIDYEKQPVFECKQCPQGTYKDNTINQFENCTTCPTLTTIGPGAKSSSECSMAACKPGEYRSSSNMCIQCPRGEYQHQKWKESCIKCDIPFTTRNIGSKSKGECRYSNSFRFGFRIKFLDDFYPQLNDEKSVEYQSLAEKIKNELFSKLKTKLINLELVRVTGFSNGSIDALIELFLKFDPTLLIIEQEINDIINSGKLAGLDLSTGKIIAYNIADGSVCSDGKYRETNGGCIACNKGYYQPNNVVEVCIKCKDGYTTVDRGSSGTESAMCVRECEAGFKVDSAGVNCEKCGIHTYKEKTNTEKVCISCTGGRQTSTTGSKSESDCFIPCPIGEENLNTSNICTKCRKGFFKEIKENRYCTKCNDRLSTISEGSTLKSECISICEVEKDGYCNGRGTCLGNEEEISCQCRENYSGDKCEIRDKIESNTNYIIGGVIGGVGGLLFVILISLACCLCMRQKILKAKKKKQLDDHLPLTQQKQPQQQQPQVVVAPALYSTAQKNVFSPTLTTSANQIQRPITPMTATLPKTNTSYMYYEERDLPDIGMDLRSVSMQDGYGTAPSATFFAKK